MNDSDKNRKPIINNLKISFDPSEAYMILGKQVETGEITGKPFVKVSPEVKTHKNMRHTASLETLGCILNNLTFRCSSLTSANLNDQREKERVNIEPFAASRFISCFSHMTHESVQFWGLYGDKCNKKNNVQLVFMNFGNFITDAIHMDYCLIAGGKKALFDSKELNFTSDTDMRNWISSIELIDIEYLPSDDTAFSEDYSGEANIQFGSDSPAQALTLKQYRPECLGRQKSDTWDSEKESRILCCLHVQDFKEWKYIDLRLKDEIFRDMVIIMNPWADTSFEQRIRALIDNSEIPDDIKASITIQHSSEKDKITL